MGEMNDDEIDVTERWFIDDDEVTAREHEEYSRASYVLYGSWLMMRRSDDGNVDYVALSPERVLLLNKERTAIAKDSDE